MARGRTIKVTLVGDAKSLNQAFGKGASGAAGLAGSLKKLAGPAAIGAVVAGAGAATKAGIDMAVGFESSMSKIVGLVGISREQVQEWGDDIKQLAPEVAQAPEQLADALFFITSAGLRGQEAMDTLEASARAATAGLGETKDVAFAAVSAMNAYGSENLSAADAVDILTNTVRQGNVEASEVAGVLGRIIPVASNLGVSFDQVGAAVAAMTRQGADAAQSVTQLSGIFRGIIKPSKEAEETLAQYGLSSQGLKQQLDEEGLLSVLNTLSGVFADNEEAATKVFGRIQGLTGFLSLMGAQAEGNVQIFEELANSTGVADEAFGAAADTAEFSFNQALTELKVIGQEVGEDVLPFILDALRDVLPQVKTLAPAIGDLIVTFVDLAEDALPAVQIALEAVGFAVKVVAAPFEAVNATLDAFDTKTTVASRAADLFNQAMVRTNDESSAAAQVLASLADAGELNSGAIALLAEESGMTVLQIKQLRDEALELADAQGMSEDATSALNEQLDANRFSVMGGDQAYLDYIDSVSTAGDEADSSAEDLRNLTEEERAQAEATEAARQALVDKQEALREIHNPMFRFVRLTEDLEEAEQAVADAEEEYGKNSQEYRDAVLERAGINADLKATFRELKSQGIDPTGEAAREMFRGLGVPQHIIDAMFSQFDEMEGNLERRRFELSFTAPEIEYRAGGTRSRPTYTPVRRGIRALQRGGIMGPNNEMLLAGEGPTREAFIPLDQRGIDFMASALQKALGRVNLGGGSGGLSQEFIIQGGQMTAQELADEIDFRRRTSGI